MQSQPRSNAGSPPHSPDLTAQLRDEVADGHRHGRGGRGCSSAHSAVKSSKPSDWPRKPCEQTPVTWQTVTRACTSCGTSHWASRGAAAARSSVPSTCMLQSAEREGDQGWRSCALSSRAFRLLQLGDHRAQHDVNAALQDLVDAEIALAAGRRGQRDPRARSQQCRSGVRRAEALRARPARSTRPPTPSARRMTDRPPPRRCDRATSP